MTKLNSIKVIHTIIWIFFNVVIFYLFYAVITNRIDVIVWVCISFVILEGIVLLFFKGVCPLTIVARKYSDSHKDNFDIFLPNWLAKYNKMVYTIIFITTICILIYKIATR